MSTTTLDEWDVSPKDLATMLKISVRTVWGWNAAGTAPRFIRVGKHVRYSRRSVEEWIAAKAEGREAVSDAA
jgi:predicted DNA-binding transcriptional regulator AlpA